MPKPLGKTLDQRPGKTLDRMAHGGRRGFLGGLGAGGLTVAMTVFGTAPAEALVAVGCCTLCRSSSGTLSQCKQGTYYVWYCQKSAYQQCTCCERGASSGCSGVVQSFGTCYYP